MHVVKELNQVLRAQRHIEANSNGESSLEEIANRLGKSIEEVRSILALSEHTASLDAPLDIDPSLSIGESLADDERAKRSVDRFIAELEAADTVGEKA